MFMRRQSADPSWLVVTIPVLFAVLCIPSTGWAAGFNNYLETFGSETTFASSRNSETAKPVSKKRQTRGQKRRQKIAPPSQFSFFDFFSGPPEKSQTAVSKPPSRPKQKRRKSAARQTPRGPLLAALKSVKPSGLPLSLAVAVITVESNWRVRATGAAGERGLMQLKPATARFMGVRGNLYNPKTNLLAGTRYLNYCYRRAKGNVAGTIGCYNLGPGRMWAWNKNPITRNYVSKVHKYIRN